MWLQVGIFLMQASYQQPDTMLFFTVFYWQWVRIRCMLGTTTKESFAAIDRFISPVRPPNRPINDASTPHHNVTSTTEMVVVEIPSNCLQMASHCCF